MPKSGSQRKQKRIFVINVRKLCLLAVTILLCVLTVISGWLVVRRFLSVSRYEVIGITRYDREELISASGVKKGDLLYVLDEKKIEERILKECPYLSSVAVKVKYPNTVRIEVEGKTAQWYLDISGAKYTLDDELRVVSEVVNPSGITKLVLPNIQSAIYGEVPRFGESETEIKRTLEVIDTIRRTPLKDRLTEVNLESRWNISLEVDEKYRVSLGDLTDLEDKLRATEAFLDRDTVKEYSSGTITITKGRGGYTGEFLPDSVEAESEKSS